MDVEGQRIGGRRQTGKHGDTGRQESRERNLPIKKGYRLRSIGTGKRSCSMEEVEKDYDVEEGMEENIKEVMEETGLSYNAACERIRCTALVGATAFIHLDRFNGAKEGSIEKQVEQGILDALRDVAVEMADVDIEGQKVM